MKVIVTKNTAVRGKSIAAREKPYNLDDADALALIAAQKARRAPTAAEEKAAAEEAAAAAAAAKKAEK